MQKSEQQETSKKSPSELRQQAVKKVTEYILAAFGLVAGLAWNEAVKALIEYWFPLNTNSIGVKFSYALFLTIILVIITVYLINLFKKDDDV